MIMLKNVVRKNSYYDSATLMLVSSKVAQQVRGSKNIAVLMSTEMNKELMRGAGLLNEDGEAAAPNDLIFAVRSDTVEEIEAAIASAVEILEKKNTERASRNEGRNYKTTQEALSALGGADIAVISLPGAFAHFEAKRLLNAGVNILMFSDNVSLENENMLKDLALEKNLLMMGPDCGTAVINGVGLGFSNKVKPGCVGIVAASGTGLQEVMTLVSNFGGGISQALGTGGRDVKEEVGGKMMLHCIDMLEADPRTEIIVIVSKPPAPSVTAKLSERIKKLSKPVVACLLGDTSNLLGDTRCYVAHTLTETAQICLDLVVGKGATIPSRGDENEVVRKVKEGLSGSQKYIRGLYCGGTLSYETQLIIRNALGAVYSNAPLNYDFKLHDSQFSREHTVLDLGEDEFTVGQPHPMIEHSLRRERLLREALDPSVAVIALDIYIGYGSHDEAGKLLAEHVTEARELLAREGRSVGFFARICGSFEDYQGYETQKEILEAAGITVFETNEQCARAAVAVVSQ
jgi:succinyl-CoA synthetase alpha subunit